MVYMLKHVVGTAGGYTVPRGQDVMISVYNIHHSPAVWDDAEAFRPERFSLDKPPPTEQNTDFRSALPVLKSSLSRIYLHHSMQQ